jgi:hypothetical protein
MELQEGIWLCKYASRLWSWFHFFWGQNFWKAMGQCFWLILASLPKKRKSKWDRYKGFFVEKRKKAPKSSHGEGFFFSKCHI